VSEENSMSASVAKLKRKPHLPFSRLNSNPELRAVIDAFPLV